MRIINVSSVVEENGKIPLSLSIRKIFAEGFGWQAELDAQNQVTSQLIGVLGPEFVMLRGVLLPKLDAPIPLVLVGPPGVFILYASSLKGTFRARGDVWLALDATGNMHPAKPNLPTRARLYAEAVRKYLLKNNVEAGDVEAVLLFSRNDAFVENIKAPIRVVLADGVESYASTLCLGHPSLTPDQITRIIHLLAGSKERAEASNALPLEPDISAQAVVMPSSIPMSALPAQPDSSLREYFSDQTMARQIAQAPEHDLTFKAEDSAPLDEIQPDVRKSRISRKQAIVLIGFGLIDTCAIVVLLSLAISLLRSR
jgi:hypothetical protein